MQRHKKPTLTTQQYKKIKFYIVMLFFQKMSIFAQYSHFFIKMNKKRHQLTLFIEKNQSKKIEKNKWKILDEFQLNNIFSDATS